MKQDWYDAIVGNGNVNQGLARIVGFILLFILVFGVITWLIG